MMMPIMQFVGNLGYVMVALLGGFMVIKSKIEVGDVQAFFQYIRNFTQPIQQIAQVTNMLQSSAAASERVFEFLDVEEEEQTVENPADVSHVDGNVEIRHTSFGYDPNKIIIHDFSASVKQGRKCIVGPTGAGKTTMIKLLMRFYDVNTGEMTDSHNIKDFNRSELRELFGMVLQDTWLFHGTIMENIRYGRLDATDEEVIAAAKAAHASFRMLQPGGYQMVLNEETNNISQGQKQLLTIARAILADNRLLILDEATSSVDTRTEERIQKAMDNLMKGRTSFVIAHRLSTIRDADLILVMKDGDIIEQGTHKALLAGGFYAICITASLRRQRPCKLRNDILHAKLFGMFAPNSVCAARCDFLFGCQKTQDRTPDLCPFEKILLPDSFGKTAEIVHRTAAFYRKLSGQDMTSFVTWFKA